MEEPRQGLRAGKRKAGIAADEILLSLLLQTLQPVWNEKLKILKKLVENGENPQAVMASKQGGHW